jgi:hypothetical protein
VDTGAVTAAVVWKHSIEAAKLLQQGQGAEGATWQPLSSFSLATFSSSDSYESWRFSQLSRCSMKTIWS